MPAHPLGEFYEGFSSWRRMLAKAQVEDTPVVWSNAVAEVFDYVRKGLDKVTAIDELVDMAASIGLSDPDAVQRMLHEKFSELEKLHSVPREQYSRGNGRGDEADWDELDEYAPDIDLNRDYDAVRRRKKSPRDDEDEPASAPVVTLRPNKQRTKRGNGPEPHVPKITAQTEATFMHGLTQPEYLIDTILQRRFLYALTGKTGSGKTALALYITACVALGRSIGELEVMQGNVLYLAGENPDDIRYRWLAMGQQMDFQDRTMPVWFVAERFDIGEGFEQLRQQMGAIGGVSLVVVDTSAAYFQGDEVNSNTQLGDHARTLRGLIDLPGGPAVLALTHPVKNAAADNLIPLGAGAFLNEVDGNLTCAVEGSAVELHWQGKIRGPDFAPVNFELKTVTHERLTDSRGRLIPTVVVRHLSDAAREGINEAAKGAAYQVLAQINDDPKASQRDYATRLGWNLSSGKPHFSRVNRAVGKLTKARLVTVDELGGFEVTEKGKKRLQQAGSGLSSMATDPADLDQ